MFDDPNILLNAGIFLSSLAAIVVPLHIDNRSQRRKQTSEINEQGERLARSVGEINHSVDSIDKRLRKHERKTKKLRRYVVLMQNARNHERSHRPPDPPPPQASQRHGET